MTVSVKKMRITPHKAKIYLKNNPKNRKVRHSHVLNLSRQMADNQFVMNGNTIVFGKSGALLDGQHRLHGVIHCDMPQWFIVVFDVDDAHIKTIDTGINRSLANIFEMEGQKYFTNKASVAIALMHFKHKVYHLSKSEAKEKVQLSNEVIFDFYMKHSKRLDFWIKYVMCTDNLQDFHKTNLALALFFLEREYKLPLVNQFLAHMQHGGDYPYSPSNTIPKFIRKRKEDFDLRYRCEDLIVIFAGIEQYMKKEPFKNISMKDLMKTAPVYYAQYKIR